MPKTPDPIDQHVGRRVRTRRLMLNMSQEALGDQVGITFQQIQKYEKGTNRISASRLQQISRVLGVSAWSFFEGAPSAKAQKVRPPDHVDEFLANAYGLALMKSFTKIQNAPLRRSIVYLVEAIALTFPVA